MQVDPGDEQFSAPEHGHREVARYLSRAIGTLLFTPPHERLYRHLKQDDEQSSVIVPIHSDIPVTIAEIEPVLARVRQQGERRSSAQLGRLAALLMQFGNHFHDVPEELHIEYETVQNLHDRIVQQATDSGRRLTLGGQLGVSLDQTEGNLAQSLHTLFVTSRFYARWLDETTIQNIPEINTEQRLILMRDWQASLMGFKEGRDEYHDTAGDTYYAWTHAYAGYVFEGLPERRSAASELGRVAFEHGTFIMQTCVNNLNPRGIISDHTVAARYGNAVAKRCVRVTRE